MIMVCSRALTDFLVGLVVQPLYIGQQLSRKSNLLTLEASVGHSVCGVSFLTITAISLDRFLALHYHLRYFTVVTKFPIICTAAIIWLFSSPSMALFFWNRRLHRTFVGFIVVICFMVSTFSYVGIYYIVRKHQRQIHIQQNIVEGFRSWNKHPAFEEKCCEHILVLYRSYTVLFPIFCIYYIDWSIWAEMESAMELFSHCSIHEFICKPIFALLPYSRATHCSFEHTEKDVV